VKELSNLGLRDRSMGLRLPPSLREGEQKSRAEAEKKRDSLVGSLLNYQDEASQKVQNRIFVASDQHLAIKWSERSIDGFLEDLRDFQFNNDIEIRSIFGHIDKNIRDYIGTILQDLWQRGLEVWRQTQDEESSSSSLSSTFPRC
jgi:hypothetical protein